MEVGYLHRIMDYLIISEEVNPTAPALAPGKSWYKAATLIKGREAIKVVLTNE